MDMYSPRLTNQQQKQFTTLYKYGYTARYIFLALGQVLSDEAAYAKMRDYRIKLNLPKRRRKSKEEQP